MSRNRPSFKNCPRCGKTFNSLGLPNHRAHCKGSTSAPAPTPIPTWPFPSTAGVHPSSNVDGYVEAGLVCQACAGDAPRGKCKTPKCIGGPIVRELVPAADVPVTPKGLTE